MQRKEVLDHGFIELVKHCASDLDVVNSARVSLHQESIKLTERDEGLIRFLMREHHGTPFEHGYFQFRVKAPIFVFREWHRHRVGHSYNEWSGRYSKLEPEFYTPAQLHKQTGKPGAYTFEPLEDNSYNYYARETIRLAYNTAYEQYEKLIFYGVSKQEARLVLPVATYSEMIWSCNPRSLMHFLSLRNAANAQMEIRVYANAAEEFFRQVMPVTADAFVKFGRIVP